MGRRSGKRQKYSLAEFGIPVEVGEIEFHVFSALYDAMERKTYVLRDELEKRISDLCPEGRLPPRRMVYNTIARLRKILEGSEYRIDTINSGCENMGYELIYNTRVMHCFNSPHIFILFV